MTDFTPEQLSAINTRDRTLLVSAAAGSGKTATLTERIIRSILDKDNPIDISDMLIVTFTRAAARELGEKITRAIKLALSADRDNERLKRQLVLIPAAKISTIDSFCADILKSNTEKFGISPHYRIADTAEANILSLGIINAMLEETLNGEAPDIADAEEFEELCSLLVSVKGDEGLAECFLSLHEKSKSALEGAKIFSLLAKRHSIKDEESLEENEYVKYAVKTVNKMSEHYLNAFRALQKKLLGVNKSEDACIENIDRDIEIIAHGVRVRTYQDAQAHLEKKLPKKPSVKKEEITDGTNLYKALRDEYKASVDKTAEKLFSLNENEWREAAKKSEGLTLVLARFIEKFDRIYFEEKRRLGILEYSDVEKLALGILYDGEKESDAALALKEQFKAVYIDEYQDVSPIQDAIFDAISKKNNRFMVGDVKQSIYGFRSARPEIFVNMKNSFPMLKDGEKRDSGTVFMSKNFRCDEQIIIFVNEIFDKMFNLTKESIGYRDGDRLSFGKGEACEKRSPQVHVFTRADGENASENRNEYNEDELSGLDENELTPSFVSKKIKELVAEGRLNNGSRISYSDIAILFRHNDTVKKYKEALDREGIPCEAVSNKDFFLNPDVLLMLCLLNTIDNPRRDIYLAGLLSSPLFSFTPDELYEIKANYNAGGLYSSLVKYSEMTQDKKAQRFLYELHRYRALSEGVGIDVLISKLYSETGIVYLASKNKSKSNLMLLYNYAKNYEKNGYKGLYSFISYINNIIENKERFETISESEDTDAVKIASVHASKGLEYPVVFLVEAQRTTGSVDRRAKISYREDFGIGFKLRDPSGLALVNNPIKNAISLYQDEKNFEEELRVLYVALTRARERLFVIGRSKDAKEDFWEKVCLSRLSLSPYSLSMLRSFLDVVLATCDRERIILHSDTECTDNTVKAAPVIEVHEELDGEFCEKLSERFSFKYGYAHHSLLPEKLSISHLYPSVLDEGEDELPSIDGVKEKKEKRRILPKFISGKADDESAKAGIATHTFMQFCDFENLTNHGGESELSRLVEKGFISAENAARVRLNEIELFIKSALFKEIREAKKLYRELRFNCSLPAASFTESKEKAEALSGEEILLQGVIDCIIEKNDGSLHLIDYKTDRLTKEELCNRHLAEEKLKAAHTLQLTYYKMAIEKIFGKAPSSTRIYSLPLGDGVYI